MTAKEPWQMTQEEIEALNTREFVVGQLRGDDIAMLRSDGKIILDPDKFFGHSVADRKDIIAHERAHRIESTIAPEEKARLFDDTRVMAYRGRNIDEKLANMIQDGKLPPDLAAKYGKHEVPPVAEAAPEGVAGNPRIVAWAEDMLTMSDEMRRESVGMLDDAERASMRALVDEKLAAIPAEAKVTLPEMVKSDRAWNKMVNWPYVSRQGVPMSEPRRLSDILFGGQGVEWKGDIPESVTLRTAQALHGIEVSTGLPPTFKASLNKKGRVPIEIALDQVASELGFSGANGVDDMMAHLKQLRKLAREGITEANPEYEAWLQLANDLDAATSVAPEPVMAAGTSVQSGLPGVATPKPPQVRMFGEFGGAPGSGGAAPGLMDRAALEAAQKAKPLPGQGSMDEALRSVLAVGASLVPGGADMVATDDKPSIWTGIPVALAVGWISLRRRGLGARTMARTIPPAMRNFILPTDRVLDQQLFKGDWQRNFAAWASRSKIAESLLNLVNPSAKLLTESPAQLDAVRQAFQNLRHGTGNAVQAQEVITAWQKRHIDRALIRYAYVKDMGDSIKNSVMSLLREMDGARRSFKVNTTTMEAESVQIAAPHVTSRAIGDVLEHPNWYHLTPEQSAYVERMHAIMDFGKDLLRSEGIDVHELPFEVGAHYVHRVVNGKPTLVYIGTPPVGGLQSFERSRLFREMEEGVQQGIKYGTNTDDYASTFLTGVFKRVADKRLGNAVIPLGRSPSGGAPRISESALQHPAFRGRIFPVEVHNRLAEALADTGNKWIRRMGQVSGVGRTLTAAADFSAPLIQGLPVLGRNPKVWANATLRHLETFLQPAAHQAYLADNMTTILDATRAGLFVGEHEYYAGLGTMARLSGKLPGKAGVAMAQGVHEVYGRFGASFGSFGDVARVELWKAMRNSRVAGDPHELASMLNRWTGVMSSAAAGVGRTQREWENAWGFFAPRYVRAGFGVVLDAAKGGPVGMETLRAVGGLAAGGLAFYYGLTTALGQKAYLNPLEDKSRFMTIEVDGQHVGVGGFMTALVRFAGDVLYDLNQPDRARRMFPIMEKDESWQDYITRVRFDQPFVKFFFGRAAPLQGLVVNMAEQKDYLGQPLETVGDYLTYAKSKLIPMSAEQMAEHPSVPGFFAAQAGLRVFRLSANEQRDFRREQLAQEHGKRSWQELPQLDRRKLEVEDKALRDWTAEADRINRNRTDKNTRLANDFKDATTEAKETYGKELTKAAEVARRTEDWRAWRESRKIAGAVYGAKVNALYADPKYQDMLAQWEEVRLKGKAEMAASGLQEPIQDLAYDEYQATIGLAPDLDDDGEGNYNFDLRRKREDAFKQKWGKDMWAYVQARKNQGKGLPPEELEYQQAQDLLRPYWEMREAAFGAMERAGIRNIRQQVEKYDQMAAKLHEE
ncbi:MAG: hypothetical protein ABIJ86_15925, partial [Spirochaetota bacterium]